MDPPMNPMRTSPPVRHFRKKASSLSGSPVFTRDLERGADEEEIRAPSTLKDVSQPETVESVQKGTAGSDAPPKSKSEHAIKAQHAASARAAPGTAPIPPAL